VESQPVSANLRAGETLTTFTPILAAGVRVLDLFGRVYGRLQAFHHPRYVETEYFCGVVDRIIANALTTRWVEIASISIRIVQHIPTALI